VDGAESVVRTLGDSGVDVCFASRAGCPAEFVNAFAVVDGVRAVFGLSERLVTSAADGYARMTGKPAATLLPEGPGLANAMVSLDTARRSGTPVVNIIGGTADVAAFAGPVSDWIHTSRSAGAAASDVARAVLAARTTPGGIASLALPADTMRHTAGLSAPASPIPGPAPVSDVAVERATDALRSGRVMLLLNGATLHGPGLRAAERIASATGARLWSDAFAPRIERGARRVRVAAMPTAPDDAAGALQDCATLILVGSSLPPHAGESALSGVRQLVLAHPHEDGVAALQSVAAMIDGPTDASPEEPVVEFPDPGPLDTDRILRVVATLLPEGAIVCDESASGTPDPSVPLATAAHDHLPVAGGARGIGMSMATGAAIACPDRTVLTVLGEAGAAAAPQALWTQARENLDVVTVIHASAPAMVGRRGPQLDWVSLAEGMGAAAVRVEDTTDLEKALRTAFTHRGPLVIQAV
jgi:acetolactate synthase-1/2/3 large subunit